LTIGTRTNIADILAEIIAGSRYRARRAGAPSAGFPALPDSGMPAQTGAGARFGGWRYRRAAASSVQSVAGALLGKVVVGWVEARL